jgi:aryl-alcohol dehydrogenase-like predicted oxidoreductase
MIETPTGWSMHNIGVLPICLRRNVFRWTSNEKEFFEVLDAYVAGGGNFVDTADVLGVD